MCVVMYSLVDIHAVVFRSLYFGLLLYEKSTVQDLAVWWLASWSKIFK